MAGKAKKPSAADRTVDMFAAPPPMDERQVEVVDADEKGLRVSVEADVDRVRDKAFQCQVWASKYFGLPDATGNEYRVSYQGGFYYVETLYKRSDGKTAYGGSGVMVHEHDLYNFVRPLVEAVKAKQKRDANETGV